MKNKVLHNDCSSISNLISKYYQSYSESYSVYRDLCEEVKLILKTSMKDHKIKYSIITSRIKRLDSFCEKISRKNYNDPKNDIKDIAGVRLVYLYRSDLDSIKEIINNCFDVQEETDKIANNDIDKFGYGAIHYIVKIKKEQSGERYKYFNKLVCEIQVRTILQDAWAIIAHHLSYKQEKDIPDKVKRQLNAMAAQLETADEKFDDLRKLRTNYQDDVQHKLNNLNHQIPVDIDMNFDNFIAFLKWKFPNRTAPEDSSISLLFQNIKNIGINNLYELNTVIDECIDIAENNEKEDPPLTDDGKGKYDRCGIIRECLKNTNNNI